MRRRPGALAGEIHVLPAAHARPAGVPPKARGCACACSGPFCISCSQGYSSCLSGSRGARQLTRMRLRLTRACRLARRVDRRPASRPASRPEAAALAVCHPARQRSHHPAAAAPVPALSMLSAAGPAGPPPPRRWRASEKGLKTGRLTGDRLTRRGRLSPAVACKHHSRATQLGALLPPRWPSNSKSGAARFSCLERGPPLRPLPPNLGGRGCGRLDGREHGAAQVAVGGQQQQGHQPQGQQGGGHQQHHLHSGGPRVLRGRTAGPGSRRALHDGSKRQHGRRAGLCWPPLGKAWLLRGCGPRLAAGSQQGAGHR